MQGNSILKNGFRLMAGGRSIRKMQADNGYGVKGLLDSYDKPSGFVPGSLNGASQGYSYGSEIINSDGRIFKCIDPTDEKARWVELQGELTHASYNPEASTTSAAEAQEIEKQDPSEESPGPKPKEDTPQDSDKTPEPQPESESTASKESEYSLADLPWSGWLEKAGVKTLDEAVALHRKEGLGSVSYITDDREKIIVEKLREIGYDI